MVMKYFYPDINDKLISSEIEKKEPFSGYWDNSEKFVLSGVMELIQGSSRERLVDAGTGEGRLSKLFAPFFDEVIALDPDPQRLAKAQKSFRDSGTSNIQCIVSTLQDAQVEKSSCDMVLISHIIQHVPTTELNAMFKKAHALLKEGGKLVLMTNHSTRLHDRYTKQFMKNCEIVNQSISEEEFNSLTMNKDGILPIHHFTIKTLRNYLNDFEVDNILVFHELLSATPLDRVINRDKIINVPLLRHITGRDVYALASK